MGGKSKQSQRTKNNVRPSSSGRSAELLSNIPLDKCTLNSGGGQLPTLFPSLSAPILDPLITPELQLCFKKLGKKDPITKTKALQELSELVTQSKVDDVVAALSGWSHFYRILSVDPDRKVREMTQVCHGHVVRVCGRRTAPALRALMAAWLTAQHDDHAPARHAAQRSLQSTFPENKLPEALAFCKEEVMTYFVDNLTGGAEAGAFKKAEDPEECARRLAAGCLRGVRAVCEGLPRAHDAWLWARLDAALGAPNWWRRAAAPDAALRAAWFAAMGGVAARFAAQFAARWGTRLLRAATAARELDPLVAAQLWDCLLVFMHAVQDWHQYLEKPELFSKRILDVLENGGWGEARRLADMLVPLVASLPPAARDDAFYERLFDALFRGLEQKRVLTSKSELRAWIGGVEESVRHSAARDSPGAADVVRRALRRWVRAGAAPRPPAQAPVARHSGAALGALLREWAPARPELVDDFWRLLDEELAAPPAAPAAAGAALAAHAGLLRALDAGLAGPPTPRAAIQFADADATGPRDADASPEGAAAGEAGAGRRALLAAVQATCARWLRAAEEPAARAGVLAALVPLMREFDSAELFAAAGRAWGAASAGELLARVLRPWLAAPSAALVDLALAAAAHAPDADRDAVFDSFDKLPAEAMEWAVRACALRPAAGAGRWLRAPRVARALDAAAARAAQGDAAAADLLLACLARPHGEASAAAARALTRQLAAALAAPEDAELAGLAALAADAVPAAPGCELPLALFQLTLLVKPSDARLGAAGWRRAARGWAGAARAAGAALRDACLHSLLRRLRLGSKIPADERSMIASVPEMNVPIDDDATAAEGVVREVEHAARVWARLAGAGGAARGVAPAARGVVALAARADAVRGRLASPLADGVLAGAACDALAELSRDECLWFVTRALFRALCLRAELAPRALAAEDGADADLDVDADTTADAEVDSDADPTVEAEADPEAEAEMDPEAEAELLETLHDAAVLRALRDSYTFWPHYEIIERTSTRLESALDDIINAMSASGARRALRLVAERAAARGHYWAHARAHLAARSAARGASAPAPAAPAAPGLLHALAGGGNLHDIITGNGFFHMLQADADSAQAARDAWWASAVRALCAEHADVVAPLLAPRRAPLDPLVDAYYTRPGVMLYDTDVWEASWAAAVSNAAVLHFLRLEVELDGWSAPQHHWDFVTISLCSLLNSAEKSKRHWATAKVALVTCAALRLLGAVSRFAGGVAARAQRERPSAHVAHLPAEWDDVFAPDTHTSFFGLALHVLECDAGPLSSPGAGVAAALTEACDAVSWARLPALHRHEEHLRRVAGACVAALTAPRPLEVQWLAHRVLALLAEPMVLEDAARLAAWGAAAEEEAGAAPALWAGSLARTAREAAGALDAELAAARPLEDAAEARRGSARAARCAGALLLGAALHALCRRAADDLAHHYMTHYRESEVAIPLAAVACRLLPARVLPPGAGVASPADCALFAAPAPDTPRSGEALARLACAALGAVVRGGGAAALRAWRAGLSARAGAALDHVVARYITPAAVRDEFALLARRSAELEDAAVSCSAASRSAWVRLTLEERELELSIVLGRTFPLALPEFSAPPPANNTHWLVLYVGYQNGSIWGAVRMWAEGVSCRVGRAAQCYICYCRLHPASGRLPSVTCYQCKNKFHNLCLRKWFSTSSKSNCPLCRSKF